MLLSMDSLKPRSDLILIDTKIAIKPFRQVSLIITSHSLLPNLKESFNSGKCPNVKIIIYMEDPLFKTDTTGFPDDVNIVSFDSVLR